MPLAVPRPRAVALVRHACTIVAMLAVGLATVEGMSSLFVMFKDRPRPTSVPANFRKGAYDPLIGWVGLPNLSVPDNFGPGLSLTTNADGMRVHRPVDRTLDRSQRRAICSGDSFTYGSGVGDADTFCAQLEQRIPGLVTLNMAQPGFGIDQAYLWYKRDAARYPHSLHLFAFIWNDFERMTLRSFWGYNKPILRLSGDSLVTDNVPVPPWVGEPNQSLAAWLATTSRLGRFVQQVAGPSDEDKLRRVEVQIWDVAEAVFRDLVRLNKERGSTLVLVYLPGTNDYRPGAYDARRKRVAGFASKAGISLIDLTAELRQLPADTVDWMFITPNALPVRGHANHYTVAGHRWVAASLAQRLLGLPSVARALDSARGAN